MANPQLLLYSNCYFIYFLVYYYNYITCLFIFKNRIFVENRQNNYGA